MMKPQLTVAKMLEQLNAAVAAKPEVAEYTVLWSNALYADFRVNHEGRWVMLGARA
jgi:hypothetical protein